MSNDNGPGNREQGAFDRDIVLFQILAEGVGEAVERLYREVRALRIYEGTSMIQKGLIARAVTDSRTRT